MFLVNRGTTTTDATASRVLANAFDDAELYRLQWLRATFAAECHRLGGAHQPCSDHQSCRRLAFALWLRCRGSLTELIDHHPRPGGEQRKEMQCSDLM